MAGDTSKKKLVGRHKRVAFMDVAGDGKTYTRMTGFTSLSDGKNSAEYSRQYVDEASERSDVVGYAPSMDYEFDLYTNDAVQKKLATGVIKGIYTKKLSSETGFKGLLKKIVMFIVIAVSFSIQELIGNTIPLREVVIMFYICNEALSLLENAAVFVPIPDKLRDVLIQLRDKDTEEDSEGE